MQQSRTEQTRQFQLKKLHTSSKSCSSPQPVSLPLAQPYLLPLLSPLSPMCNKSAQQVGHDRRHCAPNSTLTLSMTQHACASHSRLQKKKLHTKSNSCACSLAPVPVLLPPARPSLPPLPSCLLPVCAKSARQVDHDRRQSQQTLPSLSA